MIQTIRETFFYRNVQAIKSNALPWTYVYWTQKRVTKEFLTYIYGNDPCVVYVYRYGHYEATLEKISCDIWRMREKWKYKFMPW